jgi:hypothetical protein
LLAVSPKKHRTTVTVSSYEETEVVVLC